LACVNGCVGGTFNVANPFIATSNINYISNSLNGDSINPDIDRFEEMYESGIFNYKLKEEDNPSKLNIKEAVEKNEKIKEIYDKLPGLDCGSCGAPTCLAHAEDVYNKKSLFYDCVVLRVKNKQEE
jgi:ArsR family metal-binding transcriptional regulator